MTSILTGMRKDCHVTKSQIGLLFGQRYWSSWGVFAALELIMNRTQAKLVDVHPATKEYK